MTPRELLETARSLVNEIVIDVTNHSGHCAELEIREAAQMIEKCAAVIALLAQLDWQIRPTEGAKRRTEPAPRCTSERDFGAMGRRSCRRPHGHDDACWFDM